VAIGVEEDGGANQGELDDEREQDGGAGLHNTQLTSIV
jgi:hypothetical protein